MTIAGASIIVWLLLSDGYHPRLGPVGSLYHSMTLYEADWFCREDPYSITAIRDRISGLPAQKTDCWHIALMTKYFILLSLLAVVYGFMVFKALAPDPIPMIRARAKSLAT